MLLELERELERDELEVVGRFRDDERLMLDLVRDVLDDERLTLEFVRDLLEVEERVVELRYFVREVLLDENERFVEDVERL